MEHDDITNHSDLVVKYSGRYLTWDNASPVLASLAVYRKSLVDHPEHHRRLASQDPVAGVGVRGKGWSRWWRSSKGESTTSLPMPDISAGGVGVELGEQGDGERPESPTRSMSLPSSPEPFSPVPTPPIDDRPRHYAKTLRLTSDQLKTLNLKKGMNQISFSVRSSYSGYATCTSRVFLWESDFQVVISDIDGTITKSDALGHVFTMIGRDWTHLGVAKLYTDIARNGYKMMYLTSRAIGQADTTREYLKGIKQNGFQLPDGPVIMSPDRLMTSLHREVIMRKPEVFKMACLRDIKRLFHERSPFYAGFGNRITDALSYRSVDIPSSRIFTIDTNGEVKMELLELAGYKSSYIHMTDLVDQMFPPINRKTAPDFTDFNFWRAPVMQFDLPDLSPPSPALSARSDGGRLGLTRLGSIASSLSRRSSRATLADASTRGTRSGTPSSPLLQATLVEEPPALDDEEDEDDPSESASMPGSLPNSSDFERYRKEAREKGKGKGTEAEKYKEEVLAGEGQEEEGSEEEREEEYSAEDDGDEFGDGMDFSSVPTDFIAGQVFDIRVEIQAPLNGSAPFNRGVPSPNFTLEIFGDGGYPLEISQFYQIKDPAVEAYNFTYFEDLFAKDAQTPTLVNVLAKSYRHVTLYNPGKYTLKLSYNGGMETLAHWEVKPLAEARVAKNVILFIGDGMTSSMITAARMLAHKSINGKYQTRMALDDAPAFGMQQTHSMDSFITDSANSATALYTGKKASVNALNAYTDSTGKPFADPKVETVFEMFRRIYNGKIGIVSTAYLADATPAAVVAHTSQRSQYDTIITQYLDGVTSNYSWTNWDGPDVLFGGGGSNFIANASGTNVTHLAKFINRGYNFVTNKTSLAALAVDGKRALGLFSTSTMATWLDRNVFTSNLAGFGQFDGSKGATDQPGLKDMTLKAIDLLVARAKDDCSGWMMMSEAASIDKAMHISDYDRALGELLELDDTVKATLEHLEKIGEMKNTLVIVTADHGHGFDVFGSSDSKYIAAQSGNAAKRNAIGTYQNSGLSEYQVAPGQLATNNTVITGPNGLGFPVQCDGDGFRRRQVRVSRLALQLSIEHKTHLGFNVRNYVVHNSSRETSVLNTTTGTTYFANVNDSSTGFFVSGNLPTSDDQGVHSLTDVPVYAWGPGSSQFTGIQSAVDIAFKIALALDLGRQENATYVA
ncbi:phosphatidate phosphatase LPIN, partial [Phenoliferia sp. Uapishka_3]